MSIYDSTTNAEGLKRSLEGLPDDGMVGLYDTYFLERLKGNCDYPVRLWGFVTILHLRRPAGTQDYITFKDGFFPKMKIPVKGQILALGYNSGYVGLRPSRRLVPEKLTDALDNAHFRFYLDEHRHLIDYPDGIVVCEGADCIFRYLSSRIQECHRQKFEDEIRAFQESQEKSGFAASAASA